MPPQSHDLINLPQKAIQHIHEQLDNLAAQATATHDRSLKRWSLQGRRIVLTLIDDAGGTTHFVTTPRNLSAGGIGLLHGAFVHSNVRCIISMLSNEKQPRSIKGTIVRCAHVAGRVHQLGIKFDTPIRVEDFIELDDERVLNVESVNLKELSGTVLYLDNVQSEQRLFKHQIEHTAITPLFASSQEECTALLEESPDLIIASYETTDDFTDWIADLRDAGYTGPVVALTTNDSPKARKAVRDAGAEDAFVKPLDASLVQRLCAEFLRPGEAQPPRALAVGGAIASATASGIPLDLLQSCAEDIRALGEKLREASDSSTPQELSDLALCIESTATSHGFEGITQAARELITTLASTMSVEESEDQRVRLLTLASKARAVA